MKHVIPHALPPTSHFVSLLTCSHSTGQQIAHFYRTIRLIIKFTKARLWILHSGPAQSIPQCTPVSTTKSLPSKSYSLTFFMHMLKEFIIGALRTTCPVSHVLNLTLVRLARSHVFFILLIFSLSWTQIFN